MKWLLKNRKNWERKRSNFLFFRSPNSLRSNIGSLKRENYSVHAPYLGFSLLELLVVVGVIAIISAIAFPSYNRYILKSRRSEAMTNLVKFQAAYEEYNAQNNTYPASNTLPPSVLAPIPSTTYYSYTSATTGTTYTITATAIAGTSQVNDTEGGVDCSTMTINNIGTQTPATCWVQ